MEKDMFIADHAPDTGVTTVRLIGEIDHHSAAHLRTAVDEMLYRDRPSKLVLDVSEVTFMDSSGLGLIMGRYALLEEWGGKTVIYHPNERVKRMIELAGLERIIAVEYPQTANRKMVDKHEN